MQLFVKPLTAVQGSVLVEVEGHERVSRVKQEVEARTGIPAWQQSLLLSSRALRDDARLFETGCRHGSTLHMVGHLLGGKGGFGSMLRSSRSAVKTTNFDACRDLSGRRVEVAEAEKKMAEWKAQEEERKLQQVAERHLRTLSKEKARKEEVEFNIQQFREDLEKSSEKVASAVKDGLLQASKLAGGKGKGKAKNIREEEEGNKPGTSSGGAGASSSRHLHGKKPTTKKRNFGLLEDEFSDSDDSSSNSDDDSDGEGDKPSVPTSIIPKKQKNVTKKKKKN